MASVSLEVQQELQKYLEGKGINNLIIKIVENLLWEKPDNPVRFIVDFLRRNYPHEVEDGAPDSSAAGLAAVAAAGGGSGAASDSKGVEDVEYSDTESEDEFEAEDEVGDMASLALPPPRRGRLGKRASVCAERVDPAKLMASFEKKKYPKSDADQEKIRGILAGNFLFGHLEGEAVQTLIDAFFPVDHVDADVIIQQGDPGDNFYLLDSGAAEVFVAAPDQPAKKVLTYGSGDSFGELALMYNAPRAATVKAVGDCKLWALDRLTFKATLMDSTIRKRDRYKGFLEGVSILQSLNEYERLTVADALTPKSFSDGEVIIRQGDPGDVFYLLEEGEVICTKQHKLGDAPEVVARLESGAYFGEVALLSDRPRQATVTAAGAVRTLAVDRKTFKRVMGPLTDILRRNMSAYNKYMGMTI
eukprot:PLAT5581.1.p2 GENE.PLAT5581.1~~PLAT5581.1.p2  ORF type:complete len:417 (+),score=237.91 PLAT5581.1:101-1351(+)